MQICPLTQRAVYARRQYPRAGRCKTLAADGLVLDLEDAVAPEAKETARRQVCDAVKAGGPRSAS